jgi:hypothetical protein
MLELDSLLAQLVVHNLAQLTVETLTDAVAA